MGTLSESIFAHNSLKDAVWCKKDPFWDEKCVILKCVGYFIIKTRLKLVAIIDKLIVKNVAVNVLQIFVMD